MKPPPLSGQQVIAALQRPGFVEIHRKGSHGKMEHVDERRIGFRSSNPTVSLHFGRSLAVSGDTAVIGPPKEASDAKGVSRPGTDGNAPESGAAHGSRL